MTDEETTIKGQALYTHPTPSEPHELTGMQVKGAESFASANAEPMIQAVAQGLADLIAQDGLAAKFYEAREYEFLLTNDEKDDGPLGRALDEYIAHAKALAGDRPGSVV